MAERFSCAAQARAIHEPRYGTASIVHRWLLLEEPGPWGRDALLESRIDPAVARALKSRARSVGARPILLRRHAGRRSVTRTVFVVSSGPHASWAERFEVRELAELLDLDLSPLVDHASCGGEPVSEPIYLVCTNGRHDVCCAEFGRPLARTLDASLPESVWECSHIGGDRFAGNLVCMPEGIYYGHLAPTEGPAVALAHADGRIVLDHYRGRSSHSFVVQAADYFVREATGIVALDGLVVTDVTAELDATRVRFRSDDGRGFVAEVVTTPAAAGQQLTCAMDVESSPPRYRLRHFSEE